MLNAPDIDCALRTGHGADQDTYYCSYCHNRHSGVPAVLFREYAYCQEGAENLKEEMADTISEALRRVFPFTRDISFTLAEEAVKAIINYIDWERKDDGNKS